jgi:hypothetical protein
VGHNISSFASSGARYWGEASPGAVGMSANDPKRTLKESLTEESGQQMPASHILISLYYAASAARLTTVSAISVRVASVFFSSLRV